MKPPQPVDIDSRDMKSGKFVLNPDAQAARRAARAKDRWWRLVLVGAVVLVLMLAQKLLGKP
ncbi:MAG TPA: hypothetical protein VFN37_09475 [Candidatus Baltobacteraceae bacterium]|nr:hypothetical protein [Candidatus Baltobacteraceae bacterium]